MSDLIPVTALWKRVSANGQVYYQGNWGGVRVVIFENKKSHDNQPDLRMCIGPTGSQGAPAPAGSDDFQEPAPAREAPRRIAPPPPARPAAPPTSGGGTFSRTTPEPPPDDEDDLPPPPDLDSLGLKPASSVARPADEGQGGSDDDFEDPFAEEEAPPPPPARPAARPAARKPASDRLL